MELKKWIIVLLIGVSLILVIAGGWLWGQSLLHPRPSDSVIPDQAVEAEEVPSFVPDNVPDLPTKPAERLAVLRPVDSLVTATNTLRSYPFGSMLPQLVLRVGAQADGLHTAPCSTSSKT